MSLRPADFHTLAPARLPDLFPGAAVLITGRYENAATMQVAGQQPDGTPWQVTVHPVHSDNTALPTVWARAHLRDLEDRYVTAPAPIPDLEREIIDVSLRYGVLCRFTAFVAVDQRVVTDGGTPHHITQPVEQPHGWTMPAPAAAIAGMPLSFRAAAAAPSAPRPLRRERAYTRSAKRSAAELRYAPQLAGPEPASVRDFAAGVLRRLRKLATRPADERSRWLAELAAGITRRLDGFRQDGLSDQAQRMLTDLATELTAMTDLEPTWQRVAATFEALADAAENRGSRPFWTRR
jgi:Ca-activated chloride channel family protein